jgi:hypothetical protein
MVVPDTTCTSFSSIHVDGVGRVHPSLCARTVGADSPRLQLAASLRLVSGCRLRRSLRHPSSLVSHPSHRCRHRSGAPNHPRPYIDSTRVMVVARFASRESLVTVGVVWYDRLAARLAACSCALTSCALPSRVVALLRFVAGSFDCARERW